MPTIRNWRDTTPVVAHEGSVCWVILRKQGWKDFPAEYAPVRSTDGIGLQMLQAGLQGDYHAHEEREQLYYFTRGRGKMQLDGVLHPVKDGTTVHIPPHSKHQLINDGDDWLEHIILSAPSTDKRGKATVRNWRDCPPYVGHETAIIWSIYRGLGAPGLSPDEAPMAGLTGFTLHLMQASKSGDYHLHETREQLYYFTRGQGKMKIDEQIYPVTQGDVVHIPPQSKHQLINDSEDWIEHLIITGEVPSL
ncbi:MAG: hypothetical protein CL878_01175 [Dehalococcoidia bacterium]|nr:hypothetical protein [Dehalococcoidia bacterium]